MKKILSCVVIIIITGTTTHAQEISRTFGVGLQSSLPTYGLSVKYALTDQSVVQATIAPFQEGTAHINFYGGRYIYRWPSESETSVIVDPFLYGGLGLITYDYGSYGGGNGTVFSYSAGGGVEFILGRKFGISLEAGYGRLNVSDGVAVAGIMGGGGLHFYIK